MKKSQLKRYTVDYELNSIEFEHRNDIKMIASFDTQPSEEREDNQIPVYLTMNTRVPAHSSKMIIGLVDKLLEKTEGDVLFCGNNDEFDVNIEVNDSLLRSETNKFDIPIVITNNGDHPYSLKKGSLIGVCLPAVKLLDKKNIFINNIINENLHYYHFKDDKENLGFELINEQCKSEKKEVDLVGDKNVASFNFNSIKNVDKQTIEKLKALLLRYSVVFNDRPHGSRAVGVLDHTIELINSDVKPVKHYGFRFSPMINEKLQKHIDDMQKQGVIEPSQSPWSSPSFLIKKKDGSERFVTDFRGLNQYTKGDVFPIPRIDIIFDKLAGCKYFSTIDLKSAYWQIPLRKSDRELTAFACCNSLW